MTIPVSQKALEVLQEFPVKSEYVFPSRNGMRTDFKRPWKRIKKTAGLTAEFRFRDLGRNFASMLVSASVPRMMLLTHKDIKTTQRYAHLSHESLLAGAKKADKLLNVQDKDRT